MLLQKLVLLMLQLLELELPKKNQQAIFRLPLRTLKPSIILMLQKIILAKLVQKVFIQLLHLK
jgi:hypothetical protein